MRKHTIILYLLALAAVLMPIVLRETGNPIGQPAESILLLCGMAILVIEKAISIREQRQETGQHRSLDVMIILAFLGLIGWIGYNTFFK